MTTLKDIMRDLQQESISIYMKEGTKANVTKKTMRDYENLLEESLEIAIDRIIKNLIGGEL